MRNREEWTTKDGKEQRGTDWEGRQGTERSGPRRTVRNREEPTEKDGKELRETK